MLTVRAERVARNGDWEMLASERPRGVFSRQLVLGDNLDLDRIEASYDGGVLRLLVPVAEKAKPRKIEVTGGSAATAPPSRPDQPRHRRMAAGQDSGVRPRGRSRTGRPLVLSGLVF